jgi:serine/threonine-protein kinase PknG
MSTPISPPASDDSQVAERCRATPNCTGTILDGYCTVCGKVAARPAAAQPAPSPPPATGGYAGPAAPAAPGTSAGGTSERPGTSGTPGTSARATAATTGTTGAAGTSGRGTSGTSGGTSGRVASGRLTTASSPTSGSVATTWDLTVHSGRTGSRRRGGPLVDLPLMPPVDPATAVMETPVVPEARRFCSGCNAEVGRSRDGKEGRVTGFCSKCRLPYSFVPALKQGDLVADQYRVLGCLAYGGLGWIYLAQDERVSNRWVVLKGLLNASDPSAMAAAMAERQFLARVEHPNVVRIYNVVQHHGAGYIVMEYVGGVTLKAVLKERQQAGLGPLPLELAIAYILAILPAFGYLHELGLVYNDFKPDNVMLQGDDVKLIDLGAVTRLEDPDPVVYGTEGYEAPEVSTHGPSVAGDLYSVARCLAVLVLNLPTYQTTHRHSLPTPDQEQLFHQHESFYRFLVKATAQGPSDRYPNADEMADALETVLREVTAVSQGRPRPAPSKVFGGDVHAIRDAAGGAIPGPDWRHLPPLRIDADDPAASYLLDAMVLEPPQQVKMLRDAIAQGLIEGTVEAELGLARSLIEAGAYTEAQSALAHVEAGNAREWRCNWYRGLSLLAQNRPAEAGLAFDLVYSELPGELAPKLGLALAAELSGRLEIAARHYDTVASSDPSFTSACLGLARVSLAQGDVAGAVEAYERIPPTSSLYAQAQLALARALIRGGQTAPTVADLARASSVIDRLALSHEQRAELSVELLEAALTLLTSGAASRQPADALILGQPLHETSVRSALEQAYRDLAWVAVGGEKIRLVDRANEVRPVTDV